MRDSAKHRERAPAGAVARPAAICHLFTRAEEAVLAQARNVTRGAPTRLARTAAVNALLLSILHAVIACWHKCARGTFVCRIAVTPLGVTVNFSGEQTRWQTNLAILRVGDKAKRVQLRQMETTARRKHTVGPTQPISAAPTWVCACWSVAAERTRRRAPPSDVDCATMRDKPRARFLLVSVHVAPLPVGTGGRARWWGLCWPRIAVVSVMLINVAVELFVADVVEDSGNWQAITVAGVCAPARRLVATAAVCVGAPRKCPSRRGRRRGWSLHNNASAVVHRCARVEVNGNRLGASGKRVRLCPTDRQN